MAPLFNASNRKVGGLRFLTLGRVILTVSARSVQVSISKPAKPATLRGKPVVEACGDGFKAIVKLYRNGRLAGSYPAPDLFANAGDAMAHATAGIVACNLQMAR